MSWDSCSLKQSDLNKACLRGAALPQAFVPTSIKLLTAASDLLMPLYLGLGQKWGWGWKEWPMKWKAVRIGMSGRRESPVSGTPSKNACGHWRLFCWAGHLLIWILLLRLGKQEVCGVWVLRRWEGNYFGSLVLQWFCYLTFNICEWKVSKKVIQHRREKEVKTSAGRGQHWPWYVVLYQLHVGFSPVANTTCGNRVWMMQCKLVPASLNLDGPTCFQSVY